MDDELRELAKKILIDREKMSIGILKDIHEFAEKYDYDPTYVKCLIGSLIESFNIKSDIDKTPDFVLNCVLKDFGIEGE